MPSAADIAAFVEANKATDPQAIVREANRNGVSLSDIQAATGYGERDISIWLGNNGLTSSLFTAGVSGPESTPPPPVPASAAAPGAAPVPVASPSPAPAPAPDGTGGVTTPASTFTPASLWTNHRNLLIGAGAVLALLMFGAGKKGR